MQKRASVHEMAQLLAALRAEAMTHQTHHWRTSGGDYYADHLLFERLYNDTAEFVDSVAERTMGMGATMHMVLPVQIEWIERAAGAMGAAMTEDPEVMPSHSLAAVNFVLGLIPSVRASLKARGELSSGTDNMLQGIEDKHEEFKYLLQQRVS